jgi:hypothetical protein
MISTDLDALGSKRMQLRCLALVRIVYNVFIANIALHLGKKKD